MNKNCYKDGDKLTIERWMYLNQIIITSAGNDANFYPIAGFGGLIFCIEKWFSTSTQHAGKIGKSPSSCRKLKTDFWMCSDNKTHGYNT